jgi:hypothetical protein
MTTSLDPNWQVPPNPPCVTVFSTPSGEVEKPGDATAYYYYEAACDTGFKYYKIYALASSGSYPLKAGKKIECKKCPG